MSLYSPNNKAPFFLVVVCLFLITLLIIPLRPSKWNKNSDIAQKQEIRIEGDSSQEFTNVNNSQNSTTNDSYQPDTNEYSNIIPNNNNSSEDIPPVIEEDNNKSLDENNIFTPIPTDNNNSLTFLWYLFLILGLGSLAIVIIYRVLTKRMEQKYWLKYSAKLQPLGSFSNHSFDDINLDFQETALATTDKEVVEIAVPIEETAEHQEDDTVVLVEDIEKVEKEEDAKLTVEDTTDKVAVEAENPPKEKVLPKANKAVDQQKPSVSSTLFNKLLKPLVLEFLTRPFKIVWAIFRSLYSVVSYFFKDSSETKKPLDFVWQDAISFIAILLFIACKNVIFPAQPANTTIYISMIVGLWCLPSFLRLHWSGGILGIIMIISEIAALIIHAILEATKDAKPSDGNNNFLMGLGLSLVVGSTFYWAKKNNKLPKLPQLPKLPKISITIHGITLFCFTSVFFWFCFKHYFNVGIIEAMANGGGIGDVLGRIFIFYLGYEFLKAFFEGFFSAEETQKTPEPRRPATKDNSTPQGTKLTKEVNFSPIKINYKELFATKKLVEKDRFEST